MNPSFIRYHFAIQLSLLKLVRGLPIARGFALGGAVVLERDCVGINRKFSNLTSGIRPYALYHASKGILCTT